MHLENDFMRVIQRNISQNVLNIKRKFRTIWARFPQRIRITSFLRTMNIKKTLFLIKMGIVPFKNAIDRDDAGCSWREGSKKVKVSVTQLLNAP